MTASAIGYGSVLRIALASAPTVFTTIGDVYEITPPPIKVNNIDITTMASANGYMESIAGMANLGSFQAKVNFLGGNAGDAYLQSIVRVPVIVEVTPAGSSNKWTFAANLTDYQLALPLDGRQTLQVSFDATSSPTVAALAAPTNSLLPSISGLLTNGTLITANEGTWTGPPTSYTYVWKKGGVAIGGATAKTYTLTATEVGGSISVTVTAINSAGSTAATSGGSTNVV